ncbi:AraC family transcriptional regulator [Stutzerimonas stutzeri]|uniref:AraC family transcriptional regulator n=1 Tax=Stutzerimonas stutzeri TaxID=316 RepID=W8RU27_STUST|nr:GlxA family transcriptional regulator [Stutzerimonas stutzeri]AHL75516.1 AraC family transcriptional regulator [Stutzerimonas stutzeri]MCQ4327913.1 GlxA family transcriptional regulator [Stutzerimonas stutzeri]
MKRIAILLFDDVLSLDIFGPADVFSIANRYLAPTDHYQLCTIGVVTAEVRASNGIRLLADHTLENLPDPIDLLLVPGGPGAYNGDHSAWQPWLQQACTAVSSFGSVCTGAFILGAAGLLDGCQVATHWNYNERLAQRFPRARVETDRIYVRDGKLITSGGVTAGIDMALAIIEEDHGKPVAVNVAKVLLVAMKRQGGQAQFSPLLAEVAREGSPVARAHQHALDNLEQELSVDSLALVAGLSPRHFARTFSGETGMTPMDFVHSARVDRARQLLESSDLPLKTIAYRCGFRSVRCMRIQFCERLGLTPAQYRHQFG